MPPRPRHLPHNLERTALQRLSVGRALPFAKLHPAGPQTVAGMLTKGWIEKQLDAGSVSYRITPAGEAALKARLPED
jgi:hypothetical protein